MRTPSFFDRVATSRERVELAARTYKRDAAGRFGSGGGPVSGHDVVGDLDYEAVGGAVKASASSLEAGVPDAGLRAIASRQGFDGKPEVVSRGDLDAAIAGGAIELHRRVGDSAGRPAAALAEEFRTGELYCGRGMHGSGTYATSDTRLSDEYGSPSGEIRMALRPGSRTIGTQEARARIRAESADWGAEQYRVLSDPGRYAAARGYDAIVPDTPGSANYVILNRTAVIVQEAG